MRVHITMGVRPHTGEGTHHYGCQASHWWGYTSLCVSGLTLVRVHITMGVRPHTGEGAHHYGCQASHW